MIMKFNLCMTRRCVSPRPVQAGILRFVPINFVFFRTVIFFLKKKKNTCQTNLQNKTICIKNNMYMYYLLETFWSWTTRRTSPNLRRSSAWREFLPPGSYSGSALYICSRGIDLSRSDRYSGAILPTGPQSNPSAYQNNTTRTKKNFH